MHDTTYNSLIVTGLTQNSEPNAQKETWKCSNKSEFNICVHARNMKFQSLWLLLQKLRNYFSCRVIFSVILTNFSQQVGWLVNNKNVIVLDMPQTCTSCKQALVQRKKLQASKVPTSTSIFSVHRPCPFDLLPALLTKFSLLVTKQSIFTCTQHDRPRRHKVVSGPVI
jgi:hypothetical protein